MASGKLLLQFLRDFFKQKDIFKCLAVPCSESANPKEEQILP